MNDTLNALDTDLTRDSDHLGACAVNVVLEGMWVLHQRTRMVGDDFKAVRLIHLALLNLASAKVADHRTDSAPDQQTEPSPVLNAMAMAANDAEAAPLAAQ